MNNIKVFSLFSLLLILLRCGILSINDIYKTVPKGSKLSQEVLRKSSQIILNESDLILNYDFALEWNRFDPHLLFYDKNLKLYAASYFPSHQVEFLENNAIFGVLHLENENRKKKYRNQLPKKYKTEFITRQVKGGLRISNKIVYRIELQSDKNLVKLFVKTSSNKYAGLSQIGNKIDEKKFEETDTLNYSLVQLNFDYKQELIFTTHMGENDKLIRDNILLNNQSVLDNFYTDLLSLSN